MTKKIELNINGEQKTFNQPTFIKGSAARRGLKLGKRMEEAGEEIGDDLFDDMLQFVAEYGYENKFTAQELEDGLDARDLFEELVTQIQGIISRQDSETSGKPTKAKKA